MLDQSNSADWGSLLISWSRSPTQSLSVAIALALVLVYLSFRFRNFIDSLSRSLCLLRQIYCLLCAICRSEAGAKRRYEMMLLLWRYNCGGHLCPGPDRRGLRIKMLDVPFHASLALLLIVHSLLHRRLLLLLLLLFRFLRLLFLPLSLLLLNGELNFKDFVLLHSLQFLVALWRHFSENTF